MEEGDQEEHHEGEVDDEVRGDAGYNPEWTRCPGEIVSAGRDADYSLSESTWSAPGSRSAAVAVSGPLRCVSPT